MLILSVVPREMFHGIYFYKWILLHYAITNVSPWIYENVWGGNCVWFNCLISPHKWKVSSGAEKPFFFKICHIFFRKIKLSKVIPYLKKIQKIYNSREPLPESCWHFHRKSATFVLSGNIDIDCILIHNVFFH